MDALDSLTNKYRMDGLLSSLVKNRGNTRNTNNVIPFGTPGFGGIPREGVYARQPTAEEQNAFNERKRIRDLMGKYGKGGIMREQIGAENMRSALTSQNERAKLALDERNKSLDREKDLEVARIKAASGDGLGLGTGVAASAPGLALSGKEVIPPNGMQAATPAPVAKPLVPANAATPSYTPTPRIAGTGTDAEYLDEKGFPKAGTSFSNMPSGTGTITVPKGSANQDNGMGGRTGAAGTYALNRGGKSKFTPWGEKPAAVISQDFPDPRGNSVGSHGMNPFQGGSPGKPSVASGSFDESPQTKRKKLAAQGKPNVTMTLPGRSGFTGSQPRYSAIEAMKPIYRAGENQSKVLKWLRDLLKRSPYGM